MIEDLQGQTVFGSIGDFSLFCQFIQYRTVVGGVADYHHVPMIFC